MSLTAIGGMVCMVSLIVRVYRGAERLERSASSAGVPRPPSSGRDLDPEEPADDLLLDRERGK